MRGANGFLWCLLLLRLELLRLFAYNRFHPNASIFSQPVRFRIFIMLMIAARWTISCATRAQILALSAFYGRHCCQNQLRWNSKSAYMDEKLRTIIDSSNMGTKKEDTNNPSTSYNSPGSSSPNTNTVSTPPAVQKSPEEPSESTKREILAKHPTLPLQKERLRTETSKRIEAYLDSLQKTIFRATRTLNDATGYSSIETLKKDIEQLEAELQTAKKAVKHRKNEYSNAILLRSKLQQEVNELLTRKHNWSAADLERFTDLYRNDHTNEQVETESARKLAEAELKVDSVQLKLTQLILTRYHEEQVWSDKIRSASTWGTWVIMGINVLLFFVATFIVEPWKRKRLVASFEAKVMETMGEGSQLSTGRFETDQNRSEVASGALESERASHAQSSQESVSSISALLALPWLQWSCALFVDCLKTTAQNVFYGVDNIPSADVRFLLAVCAVLGCLVGSLLGTQ